MSICMQDFVFNDFFLETQCDRNYDGTRNLILRGNDLFKKIGERVTDSDLIQITAFLRLHPEIIALEFPYNDITNCGMFTLVNFLKERPIIRYMNLICNNIGARGIKYLVELGEILPLYTLRLSGNKIGSEGGKELSKLLYQRTALKFLDLADTDQTISGLAYLMTSLMGNRGGTESLKYIDLSRPLPQSFHTVPSSHAAELIGQVIGASKHLKEIHVQQYQFDFRDMEILLEGLYANKTLICLDLNNNNIGDDGVEYLCQYLKTSPQLECLMIGSNNFSDLGATALSFNLPFSNIKLLDITNNRVTDEGMANIFYTIKKETKLKALFIWGNKLTHKSLVILQRLFNSDVLDTNFTDIKLYCSDNRLNVAWNPRGNRYSQRFYCISEYGHPPLRKILNIPPPPLQPPHIDYRYHADNVDLGLPVADWKNQWKEAKFTDPV